MAQHTIRERQGHRCAEGPEAVKPPGDDRGLGAYQGQKRGVERTREQQHTQARGAGRRDEQQNLEGGGCGRHPYGRRSALGEEVGTGCDRDILQRQTATDGGALGRIRE